MRSNKYLKKLQNTIELVEFLWFIFERIISSFEIKYSQKRAIFAAKQ